MSYNRNRIDPDDIELFGDHDNSNECSSSNQIYQHEYISGVKDEPYQI
jgi:hypothetical protein